MNLTYCPFCLSAVQSEICPHCGNSISYAGDPMHLQVGYVLNGTHPYVLGASLGQGGFGITYIALDMEANRRVAIKEYFPTYCAGRNGEVTVLSYRGQEDTFHKGKERFLEEARMLNSLSDLPSVVDVLDFFEANNSAYLVMEFLEGSSLKDHVEQKGKLSAQSFLKQMKPLMADMEQMHRRGVVHRDIAPDNIIMLRSGQLKLIDFGAARSYVGDKSMTVVVKKGFAPVEQYMRKGSNASTDIYALAATVYYCITGIIPPDSAERQYGDAALCAPTELGAELTEAQELALAKALEIQPQHRPQSITQWMDEMDAKPRPQVSAAQENAAQSSSAAESSVKTASQGKAENRSQSRFVMSKNVKILLASAIFVIAAVIICASLFFSTGKPTENEFTASNSLPQAPTQPVSTGSPTVPEIPESPKILENVTLNVLAAQYSNQTADWWVNFERAFESEYHNVDLIIDVCSWNDIYTVVNTRIANNHAPDILNIDIFEDFQQEGRLLPVQEYMSDETYSKFYPQFLDFSSADGQVWAVPDLTSVRVMLYNRDILDAAGVEVPKTWQELNDVCEAIKAYNRSIIPWGIDMTTDEGQACFAYYTLGNGGGFVDDAGNWALNSPENVQAVNYAVSLIKNGLTNTSPVTDTRYALQDMFAEGKLAMMIGPDSVASYCSNNNPKLNIGIAPIPSNSGKEPSTLAVMDRFMSFDNNHSPSELAAITAFYDFFYEDECYVDWVTTEGFLPATSTGAKLLDSRQNINVWHNVISSSVFYPSNKKEWIEVKMGVIDVQQRALMGGNVQKLLDDLQRTIAG